jgi:HEAT repeat protein
MAAKNIDDLAERELLSEILFTIKNGDDEARRVAIYEKMSLLNNKKAARNELIKLLSHGVPTEAPAAKKKPAAAEESELEEKHSEIRSWATTALAELVGKTDKTARQEVIKTLQREKEPTSRYWMLLATYLMGSQAEIKPVVDSIAQKYRVGILEKNFELAYESPDEENDRAATLAIAIQANWGDEAAADCLDVLLQSSTFGLMWSTCRALEVVSVRELLGTLSAVATDRRTWPDIRNRCIGAIGNIESPAAARALSEILANERDPILRESVIQALVNLGTSKNVRTLLEKSLKKEKEKPFSISNSLLPALLDENAQIRHRAAEALIGIASDLDRDQKDEDARKKADNQTRIEVSEKIVAELLNEKVDFANGVPKLVDALRIVDPPEAELASTVLTRYIYSDDVSVKNRAEHALKLLGGEKAVQTLIGQRSEVLRSYNELLSKADEPIQELFKETMRQARASFMISQIMSLIVFGVGILAIIAGLIVAFTGGSDRVEFAFGAGTSIVGVIAVLLDLMVRDPHKRVQEATSILLRIKVIFLGYLRQIHQIDATFKHEFIEGGKDFGQKDVELTTTLIDSVVKTTMATISQNLPMNQNEKLAVEDILKKWQESLIKPAAQEITAPPAKPEKTDPQANGAG